MISSIQIHYLPITKVVATYIYMQCESADKGVLISQVSDFSFMHKWRLPLSFVL